MSGRGSKAARAAGSGRGLRLLAIALAALAIAAAAGAASAGPGERELYDVRVFARIGNPGQPEPVAIGPNRRVYVGTNQQERGETDAPSKIFVFSRRGEPRGELELEGQNLEEEHGIQGLVFDREWRLYALDRSADPRVVRINVRTGRQRDFATFADVPTCEAAGRDTDCSATMGDQPAAPDYAAFAPDGRLYVTDIEQALIWRIPRRGGEAEVWFTDPLLENLFGPNGIQLKNRRTVLFVVTATSPFEGTNPTEGGIYRLRVKPDGSPGDFGELWRSRPFDGPDGFAIGRSGNIYLALAGAGQMVVLSPQGEELARFPASPLENQQQEVPFDGPASVAFLGRRILVTNQSFPAGNPDHWAVLDIFAGEPGLPLFRPGLP